jgi:uncharacterized protein
MKIWVDADACPRPVKDILCKAAIRLQIETTFVANRLQQVVPSPHIKSIRVDQGLDVADQYIVEAVNAGDLVITADIPLADLVIAQGATVITPYGKLHNANSIREALSMRNFMHDIRDSGIITGGPAPFSEKNKQQFANQLNSILSRQHNSGN